MQAEPGSFTVHEGRVAAAGGPQWEPWLAWPKIREPRNSVAPKGSIVAWKPAPLREPPGGGTFRRSTAVLANSPTPEGAEALRSGTHETFRFQPESLPEPVWSRLDLADSVGNRHHRPASREGDRRTGHQAVPGSIVPVGPSSTELHEGARISRLQTTACPVVTGCLGLAASNLPA